MILLRSALFNILLVLWLLVLGPSIFIMVFLPARYSWVIARLWVNGVIVLLRTICGIRVEVRGREHQVGGPAIYASKHQSAWETIFYMVLIDRPAFILKRELLRIPFFGQYLMKLNMIWINRSEREKAVGRIQNKAEAILGEGRSVIIFPEGTRTAPGKKVRYRRRGVLALKHVEGNYPVIPMAINAGLYWPRNSFIKHPGTVIVEFLPAMDATLADDAWMDTLQQRIENASDQLTREAGRSPVPVG